MDDLYGVDPPRWGELIKGVEFSDSDSDSDWSNDSPYDAKTGLGAGEAW